MAEAGSETAMSEQTERWVRRFEQEGLLGKAALLSGTAVRLTANLLDRAIERAAATVADAEDAFRRELDPNVEDAKILDEWDERRRRGER